MSQHNARLGAGLVGIAVLVAGGAAPATGTAPPPPVEIKIAKLTPLKLTRRGLTGRVIVEVTNRTDKPLSVYHEESHNVVFRSLKDGSLHVPFHTCACMKNAQGEPGRTLVPAKGTQVLKFEDWGCAGSAYRAPAPGGYELTFRVFLQAKHHKRVDKGQDAVCLADLQSEDYWRDAVSSAPVKAVIRGKAR